MQKPNLLDKETLKKVAGAFATGVTVVTVIQEGGNIHGLTISSFVSISLSPPLVGFCLQKESKMIALIKPGTKLGISILAEHQGHISDQFAGKNKVPIEVEFEYEGEVSLIKEAHAWYNTRIEEVISIGDHYLVVCTIHDLGRIEVNPLIYYSGYKKLKN